jgi:adenylate cyclase
LGQAQLATVELAPRSGGSSDDLPIRRRPLNDERRLVSVLFAELSGPVGMSRRLDPEEMRQIVGDALAGLIAEVEGLGGTVTSVSGTGLAAIFGAPQSHEDDPERAVRAGGRILSATGSDSHVPQPGALSIRVGIETGPAVVGPLGAGTAYGAVGEVVGAAAAVQSAAKAGSVLVGPVTRAATEGVFEWGPTENVAPTPGAAPLVASYLERPKARPVSYRGQRRLAGPAPLVGRQAELAVLEDALRGTASGTGSVVFIVGEPGLGKTRLVQECRKRFMAWVGASTGRLPLWAEGRAASYASSSPYGLYQQLLSAWVGAAPEQGEEAVRPALERAMKAMFGGQVDHARFLAHMMGLPPSPEEARLARLSPEGLQRATFASVNAVVARMVDRGPTVLVLEDLHWADPISLRLTEQLAALASDGPLLLIATRRPEPDPGVSILESSLAADASCPLHKVELSPLPEEAERALARSLIGPGAGDVVVEAVCAGVEGNPLFLEERLSSLVETGALVKEETIWNLSRSAGTEVPEVLERLVRSRVDRLGQQAREVIVSASVLGREFSASFLATVAEVEGDMGTALAEVCAASLLTEVRQGPELAYRFRHALIQEAIYGGMVRQQRRQLHARAAWGLEAASLDRLEEVAAVLGHHYAAAGENERAVHHLEVAGDHAASVFANEEAITSFRAGIKIADGEVPGSQEMARAAIALRAKLGQVLWHTWRNGEAREVLGEAIRLGGPGDALQRARLLIVLGRVNIEDREFDAAQALFDSAQELLGEDPGDRDDAVVDQWLHLMLHGQCHLHLQRQAPELAMAVLSATRAVVEARGAPDRRQCFYALLSWQQAQQARYRIDEEVLVLARKAAAIATESGDPYESAWREWNVGWWLMLRGEFGEAQEQLESSLAEAERSGNLLLRAACLYLLALTALRRHDAAAVRYLAPLAVAANERLLHPAWVAGAKASLAWLAWQDKRPQDVVTLADEAAELLKMPKSNGSHAHWKWAYLWPLIAVRLDEGKIAEAVEAGLEMLDPYQQQLPDELETLLESAATAWAGEQPDVAAAKLGRALELAHDLHFF